MARPKNVDKPIEKSVNLPTSIVARVDLKLMSVLEGKVPHGAWARYIRNLINADLAKDARIARKLEKNNDTTI